MQPQSNARRSRRLNLDNRSKGKPSQESVEKALSKLGQSGTEKARNAVPNEATQNPRTQVASSPVRSPQPLPQAPAVEAKSPAYTDQQASDEVDALIGNFKQLGQFPGEALKKICASVPQADTWFADDLDLLKSSLSSHPMAFAAFEWMRSEIAGAAHNYVFKQESPKAVVAKWKLELGDLAVDRTWIREMGKLKSAPSWRNQDLYA